MELKNENYKGVSISVIEKILGNKNRVVEAKARLAGNFLVAKENTKALAVEKIKKMIDRKI